MITITVNELRIALYTSKSVNADTIIKIESIIKDLPDEQLINLTVSENGLVEVVPLELNES